MKPLYWGEYKMYSKDDACIEISNDTEYTLDQAISFVVSLGFEVKADSSWIYYDEIIGDWRGYVGVVI